MEQVPVASRTLATRAQCLDWCRGEKTCRFVRSDTRRSGSENRRLGSSAVSEAQSGLFIGSRGQSESDLMRVLVRNP